MRLKYSIFIIYILLFYIIFWYYITCFCSTKINSVQIWFKALLINLAFNYFFIQLLIPLITSILKQIVLTYKNSLLKRIYYYWIKYAI